MIIKKIFNKQKIILYLLKYIFIQNCISLFCLPLYIGYGIPFYLLSFFGNIIFTPFLTIYITSSVFFILFSWHKTIALFFINIQKIILHIWYNIMLICANYLPHYKIVFTDNYYFFHYIFPWGCLILLFLIKNHITNCTYILTPISIIYFATTILFLQQTPQPNTPIIFSYHNTTYLIQKINDDTIAIQSINEFGLSKRNIKSDFIKKKLQEIVYKKYKIKQIKIL